MNGRSNSILDEVNFERAVKRFNPETGNTHYSFSMHSDSGLTLRKFILSENSENEISGHVFEYEVDAYWLAEVEIFPRWDYYTGYFRVISLQGEVISESGIINGSSVNNESIGGRTSGQICSTTTTLICKYLTSDPDNKICYYETETNCVSFRDSGGGGGGSSRQRHESPQYMVFAPGRNFDVGEGEDSSPTSCRDGYVRNGSGGCVQQTELEKIMKCEELSDVQLNQLEKVLAEYLNNCLNIQVFGYINDNQKKFCFKIGSTSGEQGSYNYTNSDFSFADTEAINSTVFGKELYHAYQDLYYGGLSQFNNIGRSNIEFEAKLYHDLTHNGICCLVFSNSTVQTEYLLWLIEITDDFQRMPNWSELTQYYFHYLEQFIIDKPDYNYPIDYNMTPNALLNLNNC